MSVWRALSSARSSRPRRSARCGTVSRTRAARSGRSEVSHSSTVSASSGSAGSTISRGTCGAVGVVAQQEAVDELGQRHVEALVEHELVAVEHASLAHDEQVDAGDRLLAEEADDVHLERARRDDLLPAADRFDGLEPVAVARGALEVELVGGLAHAARRVRPRGRRACPRGSPRCARTFSAYSSRVHALTHGPGTETDVGVEARAAAADAVVVG